MEKIKRLEMESLIYRLLVLLDELGEEDEYSAMVKAKYITNVILSSKYGSKLYTLGELEKLGIIK